MFPYDVTCPVCMELYYRPHTCEPCKHVFCEPCLREISKQVPITTPCPMCRKVISKCKLNAGQYLSYVNFFIFFFRVRIFVVSAWSFDSFIPATMANDFRLRRIFHPRFYPLHFFSYLNS